MMQHMMRMHVRMFYNCSRMDFGINQKILSHNLLDAKSFTWQARLSTSVYALPSKYVDRHESNRSKQATDVLEMSLSEEDACSLLGSVATATNGRPRKQLT